MKFLKLSFFALFSATVLFSCAKEYSSEQLIPAEGTWEFTNGSTRYSGYLDTVYQTLGAGSNVLYIQGKTIGSNQTFLLKLYGNSFPPGSYYASQYQNSFSYYTPTQKIYQANQSIGEFIVNLNSLDSTKIEGTFSGSAQDSTSAIIQITNGKFSTY
jgi:hypothetical protein